jgi:PAS domain S-box-containing protein
MQNKQLTTYNDKTIVPFSIFNRPKLLGLLVFFILSLLFILLILQRYQLAKKSREKEAFEILNNAKNKLEEAITYSLADTKILSFIIDKDGQVNNFDSVAAQVLESGKDIDALELIPGGVIQYVYPRQGNEKLIGYNFLQDSLKNKEAYKAIEQKKIFFAGPFELKQGGMRVVGRLPVFRQNKFWGFTAVVIKMETLYKTAGIDSASNKRFYFQLSQIDPNTKKEEFFLPQHKESGNMQYVSVKVPNGEWKLSISSIMPGRIFGDIGLLALLGFLLSVLAAVFAYRFAIRPKKLNQQVLNRTKELNASENNYRSLIERVSDGFIALNNHWVYTYVNEKAGELLSANPQALIGKNIWTQFPEAINQPYYYAYLRAMKMQEYQYLEEYYPPSDKWFENHIYPSKDGLTVFFKDITDIKLIQETLKKKEEKYHTLIEQASDGIVITDMEGIILEVNKSIQQMVGFAEDEMIGYHLADFLPEEDMDATPLRIHELMQGKSLLYERRLLKKDGIFLDVEVNSKMASSHTLIGFIRDITERKKYENALLYHSRLLESVSDAVTSLDMNRCIVSWNNACEELYGFKANEVIGKKIPQLVTFEYPDSNNEAVFEKVFTEGKWKGEFNFVHPKTKEKVNLLSNINLLKDKNGMATGLIINSKNITDRKKSEEEIRISNERFELIAQATNDAVWDHDFIKNETWGNNKLYAMYGIEPGKQKINFEMFLERIHPDDASRIKERLNTVFNNGEILLSEILRFKTGKGLYRTYYDRAYIKYDDSKKPVRILGAMQDITEREEARNLISESEEKYRTLVEQASEGIFIANKDGHFVVVNKAGVNLSQYTEEELTQMTIYDLVLPEDLAKTPFNFTDLLAGKVAKSERRLQRKDGTLIDIEITAKFISGERFLAFARDISERKKADELLQKSYDDIRRLASNLQTIREDERTTIAREIHDELGQQLTGLKMDMYWLSKKINTADVEVAAKLNESIELMNATIASVRKIATDLRPSILDDLGLIAALEWQGEEFEKRSGTRVEFNNEAGDVLLKPDIVTAIFRICQELLTNVARHANASLVKVYLQKQGNRLIFSLKDDGAGFDQEMISKKKTLGLLGIKERTLLLGGTYEFKSKPGEGSETIISIPINE